MALTAVQQRLVLTQHRQIGFAGINVAELDVAFDCRQFAMHLLHQGHEVVMHQHQVIFGVVHGVQHLLWRQAHIDRVQHRTDHRHGKEALQVAVAVPIEQGHGVPGLDPGVDQRVGQLADALIERAVVVAQLVRVDDLLVGRIARAREQQAFDQQWVVVGAFCRRDYFCIQHSGSS
ncbi:hypothetical protein D3C76_1340640 [compost metagenome]